jgi:hypothetical protein
MLNYMAAMPPTITLKNVPLAQPAVQVSIAWPLCLSTTSHPFFPLLGSGIVLVYQTGQCGSQDVLENSHWLRRHDFREESVPLLVP